MQFLVAYISTLISIVALDAVWLSSTYTRLYIPALGHLFTGSTLWPALVFYPLYALALVVLVVLPAAHGGSWHVVLWRGALLGLAAYGAYDLTNLATIPSWPVTISIIDMCWGGVVSALASAAAAAVLLAI